MRIGVEQRVLCHQHALLTADFLSRVARSFHAKFKHPTDSVRYIPSLHFVNLKYRPLDIEKSRPLDEVRDFRLLREAQKELKIIPKLR
jgi:hypothetical protein